MREKVESFSVGDFEYEMPCLDLSENELRFALEEGTTYEGSFTIQNSADRVMKGVLYSSNRLLTLDETSFCNTEHTVNYRFDATYVKAGQDIKGEVVIISDCGEKALPFIVTVEVPSVETPIGKISDLFQFTNLARIDWVEAKKIFQSADFARVFLSKDKKSRMIYRGLIKSISTSQALEEFLIAIHKKSCIRLSVDKTILEYQITGDSFMDSLVLTKDHWGYAEIKVTTDAAFIELEQKFLWADSFIGNTHQISFIIKPEKLRYGNNYGRITIKTIYQTLEVVVVCRFKKENGSSDYRRRQQMNYRLTDSYLKLTIHQLNQNKHLEDIAMLAEEAASMSERDIVHLLDTYLAIQTRDERKAGLILDDFASEEDLLRKKPPLIYCTYLYLLAAYRKDVDTLKMVTGTLRHYYEHVVSDWRILWLLLTADDQSYDNHSKLQDIKRQFENGCHSPLLYYEAISIFNSEPVLLKELNDFEIQVMNYGIKYCLLAKDVILQYTYLAGKKKKYHPLIYRDLCTLYAANRTKDILTVICSTLIKGLKRSNKYFEWFRLGVENQLHITELYEYYMYTVDESCYDPLAQPVLLYFIYSSSLSDRKRAFLYANIIMNRERNETIYRTYSKRIEIFGQKQLEAHNISRNLAIIYRDLFEKKALPDPYIQHLPYVIFKHELNCPNPYIESVAIVRKEFEEEVILPLNDSITQPALYDDDAYIFLVDSDGKRYLTSIDYNLSRYLPIENYGDILGEVKENHQDLLLYLYRKYQDFRKINEDTIPIWEQLLKVEGLGKECYQDCLETLALYYYDNYDAELLDRYLEMINIYDMNRDMRSKLMGLLILRGIKQKAMDGLRVFGFDGIPVNQLVKFCSSLIRNQEEDGNEDMLPELCYYAYSLGKYDDAILTYLVKKYCGPTTNMYQIWKSAMDFELETHELEERLLIQMLFAESYIQDSFQVFHHYYRNVTNHMVVKAFLSYNAYRYIVHERVIDDNFFDIMKRELNYEDNDLYLLAWLKFHASSTKLSEDDLHFIDYQLHRLEGKGVLLPFVLQYRNRVRLPERLMDKFYVEYKTDPKKQVFIHYRLVTKDSEGEFTTERLPNTFMGIHVKEFVLFYHEILQYYITEEFEGETNITESFHVNYEREDLEDGDSKYNLINLMLLSREMKDEETLLHTMEQYVKTEYLISNCFHPIEEDWNH